MDKNILSYINKTLDHMARTKELAEECVKNIHSCANAFDNSHIFVWGRNAEYIRNQTERLQELVTQYLSIRLTLMELADSLGGDYKEYILDREEKLYER